jgi:hypothetical protein
MQRQALRTHVGRDLQEWEESCSSTSQSLYGLVSQAGKQRLAGLIHLQTNMEWIVCGIFLVFNPQTE